MSSDLTSLNNSKQVKKKIPRATHVGEIKIGDISIACCVLEDGRRLITQSAFSTALGRKGKDGSRTVPGAARPMPSFLRPSNLHNFITDEIITLSQPIEFLHINKSLSHGFEAILFPKVCKVYLDARKHNCLFPTQYRMAEACELLMCTLAQVGITALVDEATGFQENRSKDELQRLLEKFVSKELLPWTKKFPQKFFDEYRRIYNLPENAKTPLHLALFTAKYVYGKLAPGMMRELQTKNPIVEEKGRRLHAHHQFLTTDLGCPALQRQLIRVVSFMESCDDKEEFDRKKRRVLGEPGVPLMEEGV